MVVDGVGVGNEMPAITGEHIVDGATRVLRRVLEEHVPLGSDDDPEVPSATALGMLHEHASGIDAEVRLLECVGTHGRDEWLREYGELGVPAAQRRACELDALALIDALETMKRQMVLPALYDGVGE